MLPIVFKVFELRHYLTNLYKGRAKLCQDLPQLLCLQAAQTIVNQLVEKLNLSMQFQNQFSFLLSPEC